MSIMPLKISQLYLIVKLFSYRLAGDKEESRYSSYSFFTSALDGVSGQRHAPAALYLFKEPTVPTG
jgi:hypothetical protein